MKYKIMPTQFFLSLLVLASIAVGTTAFAQTEIKAQHSALKVFALQTQIRANETMDVGFDFSLEPEWHIYWRNPGDSGAAPRVDVKGGKILDWGWPAPDRIPLPPLANYGYESRVLFPIKMQPDAGVKEMVLKFEWLICRIECVPVFATVKLPVHFGAERIEKPESDSDRVLFGEFRRRVPTRSQELSVKVEEVTDSELVIRLKGKDLRLADEILIFPHDQGLFKTSVPAIEPKGEDALLRLEFSANRDTNLTQVELTTVLRGHLGERSFESTVEFAKTTLPIWKILFFAFLGGLILNLMPCVFPVLSLKVFSILNDGHPKSVRRSGWAYTAGILLSFALLGSLLLALRSGGQALGWGFQMQSSGFVASVLILFFIMGLNFVGVFDWGTRVMNRFGQFGKAKTLSGSFGTGVLAVFIASPCTAPFMGTALGATLFLTPFLSLLVFLSLGFGLAFPILLFGYVPHMARILPRPGPWMVTFKELMAFPLFATSAWLVWVLSLQTNSGFILVTLAVLIAIAFGIWLLQKSHKIWVRTLSFFVIAGSLVFMFNALRTVKHELAPASSTATATWTKFSPDLILQAKGQQAVFVDFTASWCITCQVNKLTVLNTNAALEIFRKHNVRLLKADWTDRDPVISQALQSFGRNSVPLYVYYSPTGEAKVLPEILSLKMIEQLFP